MVLERQFCNYHPCLTPGLCYIISERQECVKGYILLMQCGMAAQPLREQLPSVPGSSTNTVGKLFKQGTEQPSHTVVLSFCSNALSRPSDQCRAVSVDAKLQVVIRRIGYQPLNSCDLLVIFVCLPLTCCISHRDRLQSCICHTSTRTVILCGLIQVQTPRLTVRDGWTQERTCTCSHAGSVVILTCVY